MPRKRPQRGTHAHQRWPLSVMAVCAATGLLFVTASVSAGGGDLRPTGGDLASLLQERSQRLDDRRDDARELQESIDQMSEGVGGTMIDSLNATIKSLEPVSGLTPSAGPGVTVTLDDAPAGSGPEGLDPNVLVVHEQDIQAYVNALWAGGAEAISLQGQRLISTSGIKCAGSTVLINGAVYSPPYRIVAVGDTNGMLWAVNTTPETTTYADYAREYQLGLDIGSGDDMSVPAFADQVRLEFATAVDGAS